GLTGGMHSWEVNMEDRQRQHLSRRQALGFAASAAGLGAAEERTPAGYPLYKARGTHRELGRQQREQAARQIKPHIQRMRRRPKLSEEQFSQRVSRFQPMFERYCSHLLEEMRGLAEGAGVTLEEAMLCSIRGELGNASSAGCTSYAIGRDGTALREPIA